MVGDLTIGPIQLQLLYVKILVYIPIGLDS